VSIPCLAPQTNQYGLGFVQVVTGEGLPLYHDSGHGDLFVEYNVVLPLTVAPKVKGRESHIPHDCVRGVADDVRRQIWRQRSITTLPRGMESCSETDARAMHIIDIINLTANDLSL
jgi:DnaJ-class molecular chaperone